MRIQVSFQTCRISPTRAMQQSKTRIGSTIRCKVLFASQSESITESITAHDRRATFLSRYYISADPVVPYSFSGSVCPNITITSMTKVHLPSAWELCGLFVFRSRLKYSCIRQILLCAKYSYSLSLCFPCLQLFAARYLCSRRVNEHIIWNCRLICYTGLQNSA